VTVTVISLSSLFRRIYTLEILRAYPVIVDASSEATLRSIEVGPYVLEKGAYWKSYSIPSVGDQLTSKTPYQVIQAFIDVSVDSFMIRAVPTHREATLTVNGNAVQNGLESQEIPVPWSATKFGRGGEDNSFLVTVTAQDGRTAIAYDIHVRKSCGRGKFYDELQDSCAVCDVQSSPFLPNYALNHCLASACTSMCDVTCQECELGFVMCPSNLHCAPTLDHADCKKDAEALKAIKDACAASRNHAIENRRMQRN